MTAAPDDRFASPLPLRWRRRLHQIHRYLVAHWPPARPVRLIFRPPAARYEAVARIFENDAGGLTLMIDPHLQWYGALDSLLHEYAHAVAWNGVAEHGGAWAGAFAEIISAFEDGDALEDSEAEGRAW